MSDATQINTAIPLVVRRENYADRLTRWMEDERRREDAHRTAPLSARWGAWSGGETQRTHQDAPLREQNALSGKLAEAVSEAIKALELAREAKYRWIPVTERLPEEGAKCVVLADGGPTDDLFATCAVWRRSRRGHSELSWHIPNVNIHGYFDGAADLREVVTHWMPLPPPPK